MLKKNLHTKLDVMAVVYLYDYICEEYFPNTSFLSDKAYKDMAIFIDEYLKTESLVGWRTLQRLFSIREKPHATSYDTMDIVVQWCFALEYRNYKEFLDSKGNEIIDAQLMENEEVNHILEVLNGKKAIVTKSTTIQLDNIPITFTLGKGYTEKLIQEVSVVTGDLLADRIKVNPKEFGIFPKPSINQRMLLKETRRQSNIDKIIAKAIEFSREREASSESVDPDWIVEFFNIAQDCSNENMQYLWAKLLANEVEEPNSFSRRTLSAIKQLNPYEAKIFTKLCCCVWDLEESHFGREKMLIKDMDTNGRYSDETWSFNGSFISHLEEVGLVYDSFLQLDEKRTYNATFFGKNHKLKAKIKEQQIDVVALTQVGQEIYKIVRPEPNEEYYKTTLKYFKGINILKK